ncbi:MAG: PadR family transcriptional regulator [Christensenella sp.]|nr:PadR family transcriptional regulator [Christensenella sp.]
MGMNKNLPVGSTAMLVLGLLRQKDMYGYQMIETLRLQSQNIFELKAGTLYPLLHSLEKNGLLETYDQDAGAARIRRYYRITKKGIASLAERRREWDAYSFAVTRVLGGENYETTT